MEDSRGVPLSSYTKIMPKIVFFGSDDLISLPILQHLVNVYSKSNILAVITKPDKPKGRGKNLIPTPIKLFALQNNIKVYTPETKNDLENPYFIKTLEELEPDYFVVASYGKILPLALLKIPKKFPLNIHPSLLPKYRGPSPIHFAILNGDKYTGVTVFIINEQMDAGDIILQREIEISPEDDYLTLTQKLVNLAKSLIVEAIECVERGDYKKVKQDEENASYTRLITKKDGLINWQEPAELIERKIRAFIHWPTTYTYYKNKLLKILKAKAKNGDKKTDPGVVLEISPDSFSVQCGEGILQIFEVQPENSKKMSAKDFINGYRINVGDKLG